MSIPISPLADYVVAEAQPAQTKTASGLYRAEGATEKPKIAKVKAVGKNVNQIKVGDKIIYKGYSTTDIKVDNTDYILIKEEDILATVK
jgi:chaperonin GroES